MFLLAAATAPGLFCLATPPSSSPPPGGGPVRYSHHSGTATIVRVEKTAASQANRGGAAEGYEVWFTFSPQDEVPDGLGKRYLERRKEHQFVLCNGWCPGPRYLKKYGIANGRQFAATLLIAKQGTGTPVLLKFDRVPDTDYFEAAGG